MVINRDVLCVGSFTVCRSLRENRLDAKRETVKEKEDQHKEVYAQPVLQRIIHIRSALRTDTGMRHPTPLYRICSTTPANGGVIAFRSTRIDPSPTPKRICAASNRTRILLQTNCNYSNSNCYPSYVC